MIASLDDYSRKILYADLWELENSWLHILALKAVVMGFGCPMRYYVDNHSIFRFVEKRDSLHKKMVLKEEEAFVQWKEVTKDLNIEVSHALSPQAKGKIERPFQWIQDHLVRTCLREEVRTIEQAREVLYWEINQYNTKRVHYVIQEIPQIRYEKALEEKKTLFRKFEIRKPYQKIEDIFCYRIERTVNPYRKISLNNFEFKIGEVPIREKVELRISFDVKSKLAKVRFWYKNQCVKEQTVKTEDIKLVQF